MIAENFYIENFLTQTEADRLLAFSLGLPSVRRTIQPWGNLARFVSLGAYADFPSRHHVQNYGDAIPLAAAPNEVKQLEAALSEFAGKPVNYLSFVAYMNAHDGMNFHQHKEDYSHPDPSVWVISLGAVRAVTFRPVGCTDPRQYETLYPAHGSLYIIPAGYNTTHEHAVPSSKTPCGVRVGINCKSFSAPSHDAPFVLSAETAGPNVYDCRAGCKYPADAVYVGCKTLAFRSTRVIREGTIYGNGIDPLKGHYPIVADTEEAFRRYAEQKMLDPVFRAQAMKDLRGKHLLCWCKQDGPRRAKWCHARVWLDLVNRPEYAAEAPIDCLPFKEAAPIFQNQVRE